MPNLFRSCLSSSNRELAGWSHPGSCTGSLNGVSNIEPILCKQYIPEVSHKFQLLQMVAGQEVKLMAVAAPSASIICLGSDVFRIRWQSFVARKGADCGKGH